MSKRNPLPIFEKFLTEDVETAQASLDSIQSKITDMRDKRAQQKEKNDAVLQKMDQDLDRYYTLRDDAKAQLEAEREAEKAEKEKEREERAKEREAEQTNETISKQGNKWVVKSKKGKVLGTHDTKKKAEAQLAAIEISKHS